MAVRSAALVFSLCLPSLALLVVTSLGALAADALFARPRITEAIDDTRLVTIPNNVVSAFNAETDRGAVADDFPLEHLQLQLRRSPAQEQAVEAFVDALHDPASPQFHKWLSAAEFGARFGVEASDLLVVRGWLEQRGFRVDFVYPSRMLIDFSGTAGLVKAAFHTEIHRLDVKGVAHIANASDPSIPAALQPVVAGIVSLNDFRGRPKHRKRAFYTGPDGCNGPCYLVTPADLATIYNFNPLFRGSMPVTGRGQTVAVVEDSNLYAAKDWADFRAAFGLSKFRYGSLEIAHPAPRGGKPCADPGAPVVTRPDGTQLFDDDEATLDAEWASAAAPDATILVAACKPTPTADGVHLAIENLVNGDHPPPIISISYGMCETSMPETLRKAFALLYQQAVVEGISVFVASGDTGPESCVEDIVPPPSGYQPSQATGDGVDGWVSTPYDVAVGGTDFGDAYTKTLSTYWASKSVAPWGSAKSYIPEIPWNDTCASTLTATYYHFSQTYGSAGFCNSAEARHLTSKQMLVPLTGTNGGPSTCATGDVSRGTCKGYPKPTWQRGVIGIPNDGVRDVPDVSIFASDGATWQQSFALCYSDPRTYGTPCVGDPGTWAGPGNGGTSFSAPIVAGIQALINQKSGGKPQGNPNYVYYRLAAREYGTNGFAACNSSRGNAISPHCVFNDVTLGDNDMDCANKIDCFRPSGAVGVESTSDGSYKPTYRASIGYDLATGLGTINAANLVNSWAACSGR